MLVIRRLVASWEFIEYDCLLELAVRATCFVAVEYIHSVATMKPQNKGENNGFCNSHSH